MWQTSVPCFLLWTQSMFQIGACERYCFLFFPISWYLVRNNGNAFVLEKSAIPWYWQHWDTFSQVLDLYLATCRIPFLTLTILCHGGMQREGRHTVTWKVLWSLEGCLGEFYFDLIFIFFCPTVLQMMVIETLGTPPLVLFTTRGKKKTNLKEK